MTTRYCVHCGEPFHLRPQTPKQKFCSSPACQRVRKRQWHNDKLQADPDYRANQRSAQRAWAARNGGYWRERRQARHPSAPRDGARHTRTDAATAQFRLPATPIKMDACNTAWTLPSGLYHLTKIPDSPGEIAPSWLVAITPVDVSIPRKMDV